MLRASPLAPLCLIAVIVASFVVPAAALAADPVRTAPATPRTVTTPGDRGVPSAAGRWIVMLRSGASVFAAETRARGLGVLVDRAFTHVVHGYAAKLDGPQFAALRADPNVVALVPDAVIRLEAQTIPRGVRRVFGTKSPIAKIDGVDERVDADVAIVDTGIDKQHTGPQRRRRDELHVVQPQRVGRRQRPRDARRGHRRRHRQRRGRGRRRAGRAPVGRPDPELERRRPRVVVRLRPRLDHRPARSERPDPAAVRGRQHVGRQDRARTTTTAACTNHDPIHQAICRLVASGVTVVAAAGNNHFNASRLIPASYNEVITVSALADSGRQARRPRRQRLLLVGQLRPRTTRSRTSRTSARDVDIIAPGKCIWSTVPGGYAYLSGTSMAAPHVTGAVALYKASRPLATPAQVKAALHRGGQPTTGSVRPTRTRTTSRCSTCRTSSTSATSRSSPRRRRARSDPRAGRARSRSRRVRAEDVTGDMSLSVSADSPLTASLSDTLLTGAADTTSSLSITVPPGTPTGRYRATVTGAVGGLVRTVRRRDRRGHGPPERGRGDARRRRRRRGSTRRGFTARARAGRPARTRPRPSRGYQAAWQVDGGTWSGTIGLGSATTTLDRTFASGHRYALRVRTRDAAGNWSPWTQSGPFTAVDRPGPELEPRRRRTPGTSPARRSGPRGTTRFARVAGASIGRSFTGRARRRRRARSGRTRGSARIYVDGVLVADAQPPPPAPAPAAGRVHPDLGDEREPLDQGRGRRDQGPSAGRRRRLRHRPLTATPTRALARWGDCDRVVESPSRSMAASGAASHDRG